VGVFAIQEFSTMIRTAVRRWAPAVSVGVSLAMVSACGGSYPEPRNQLAASEASLRAAEVGGAQNDPQCALHLKRAREQVETGKALIQEGENERAEWVLRRAQADADLALALATEQAHQKQAAAAKEELDQLKESVRNSPATK
jgi:hypothetical protein